MVKNESFKERVRKTLIECAKDYKSYFVDYEYLVCSDAFVKNKYYIVDAHEDNYLHLTGVATSVAPNEFFERCIDNSLAETDFSFMKNGQPESAVKGTVRRKIKSLPDITNVFSDGASVEEDFQKNRIRCSFAAGTSVCTLGFSVTVRTRPMTLLDGNALDQDKSKPIKLVLRKKAGSGKFDEIISGDLDTLRVYIPYIKELIGEELTAKLDAEVTDD